MNRFAKPSNSGARCGHRGSRLAICTLTMPAKLDQPFDLCSCSFRSLLQPGPVLVAQTVAHSSVQVALCILCGCHFVKVCKMEAVCDCPWDLFLHDGKPITAQATRQCTIGWSALRSVQRLCIWHLVKDTEKNDCLK